MIETFELEGGRQPSAADPRTGPELVADAVAKPISVWLPAGAHAEAVVLAGRRRLGRVCRPRAIPARCCCASPDRPGPRPRTALALQVDVDGCTVTGAAHGDLSSEKVYVRFRTHDLRRAGARHRNRD